MVRILKALLILSGLLLGASTAQAHERFWNYCQKGGNKVSTQGLLSSQPFQQSYPGCTVHVYVAGTLDLATLYSDNQTPTPTALSNPFVANSDGYFEFYATGGRYDVQLTASAGSPIWSWGDIQLCDPFGPNADSGCGSGGGGGSPAPPIYSVQFNNPLGAFDGTSTFLETPQSGSAPNQVVALNVNSGSTLEIDSILDPSNNFSFNQGHQWFITSNSANYDGSTNDGFTAMVGDASTPPQTSGAITGSNAMVSSGTLTVTATGANGLFTRPGMYAYFTGCTAATQLNGNIYQVANADTAGFVALGTGLSDYSSAADTCTVELQASSNPMPFYSEAPAFSTNWGGSYVSFNSQTGGENPQAHSLTDFLAGLFGDGPEYGYGFDAQDHSQTQIESVQFIAENNGSGQSEGPHAYAIKIGVQNYTPWGWALEDGSFYSRSGFNVVSTTSLSSCTASAGLSDCTPSLNTADGGPPASETLILKICATGSLYDTLDWTIDGTTPTCASQHMLSAPTYPTPIIDDIAVVFASATGHTLGATFTVTATVSFGSQLAAVGGTYLSSVALPTPNTPTPFPSPTGVTTWSYCVSEKWNGITTNCSANGTTSTGPSTLDSGDFNSVVINADVNPAVVCTLYRTAAGGTPSTTGIIAGPSAALCSSTVVDNGLTGDSTSPPATNLTGHIVIADGYIQTPPGIQLNFPGVSGTGCMYLISGALDTVTHSCSGGGSSVEFQVNGVDTSSQTVIDFVTGSNTIASNPSLGQVQYDFSVASQAEGSLTYYHSGLWANLGIGSANDCIVSNATDPLYSTNPCVTESTATSNTIPKFGTAPNIGNSLLSDDGTTLTYTGTGGISVVKLAYSTPPADGCGTWSSGTLGSTGVACGSGGGGGTNIFDSFQFGANTAITTPANYLQITYDSTLTSTYTGAGSSGSPFIGTLGLSTTAVTPASYTFGAFTVDANGRLTAASSSSMQVNDTPLSSQAAFDIINSTANTLGLSLGCTNSTTFKIKCEVGGVVNATEINGATVPASATLLGSNSSSQLIAEGLTSAHIFVGNGSNLPASVAVSGDVAMTNAGVFTVKGINGVLLSGLATGILKNTTATGVPSIAAASDLPGYIANVQVTMAAQTVPANSCTTSIPLSMPGVYVGPPGATFEFTPTTDITGVTGWGAVGGMVPRATPTLNTLNYRFCNQTSTGITTSSSVVFNVSAK